MAKTPLKTALLLPLVLTGCSLGTLTGVAGQIIGAVGGPTISVSGVIEAPGTQVAVIAVGAGNYHLAARPDEVGAAMAHVSYAPLGLPLPPSTAITDDTGHYSLKVAAGNTYVVSATVNGKNNQTFTLTGITSVGISDPGFELDASMNMVASKLLSLGVKQVDSSQLQAAVTQMDRDLSRASATPTSTDQASAAAAFDQWAGSSLKTQLAKMSN